jgi:hypothetical protein
MSDNALEVVGPIENAETANQEERLTFHLELTPEEQEVLAAVLDNYLSDLHTEIGDTDYSEFKSMLKHRQEVLVKIRGALPGTEASTGAMPSAQNISPQRLW